MANTSAAHKAKPNWAEAAKAAKAAMTRVWEAKLSPGEIARLHDMEPSKRVELIKEFPDDVATMAVLATVGAPTSPVVCTPRPS